MTEQMDKLLIIDDEKGVREYLAAACRRLNFVATTAVGRDAVVRKLTTFNPSVILLDLQMPGDDGIQILKVLKDHKSTARIILMSGLDKRTLSTATQLGKIFGLNMDGSLEKPILIGELRRKLCNAKAEHWGVDADHLQEAIARGEIVPSYQPKATRAADGKWSIDEVEVLARWHRPDAEVILPSAFIEIAEEAGLLPALTRSIVRQTLVQLAAWDKEDINLTASVNLSPSLLTDAAFPEQLSALTEEFGVDNSRLTLELTESALTQNAGLAIEILSRMRIKGHNLAIDDFGTGYSSLEQLYRMPFNELKIDRFLVRDIGTRAEASTIVETIIMLGHKLGITVCAEGVETKESLDFLVNAGCDKVQGYYVGRPSSARIVEKRIMEFQAGGFSDNSDDTDEGEIGPHARAADQPAPIHCN